MPRKARDERLDTRTARLRLPPRAEPYWRSIQEGKAIGYRRLGGGKGGKWIARYYSPADGKKTYRALGSADDLLDADRGATLTFAQAQDNARLWFTELEQAGGRAVVPVVPLTVRMALENYETDYQARGGKGLKDAQIAIKAHILPRLGDRLVSDLTTKHYKDWLHQVALSPARLRTKATAKQQNVKTAPLDDKGRRSRRATANRVWTTFKAALNLAFREGRVASDDPWRRVQPFKDADSPTVRYLTDPEATRLINACPADLRLLVTAALLTGCRYGELGLLRPRDIELTVRIIKIPQSKSGKARVVILTDEATAFFEACAAGKDVDQPLFKQDGGAIWGKSHQFRPMRVASATAKITPAVSFHILRHTHASRLVLQGVPLAVIAAQLGHGDTRITARHYAHLAPDYIADTIRDAFKPMGIVPPKTATPIRKAG